MKSTALRLSQMSLVTAILKEISTQAPDAPMPPSRVLDLICDSATRIVAEAAIDFRGSRESMGLNAWLSSDDTGLSSKYMAHVVYGAPNSEYYWPRDEDDLGRCRRLIVACGKPTAENLDKLLKHPEWEPSVTKLKSEFSIY